MKFDVSKMRWLRILVAAVLVIVLSFIIIFLAVTIYAVTLAVQAQGPPDQSLIAQFAQKYSPLLSLISKILLTLCAVLIMNRKITMYLILHGLLIGFFVVMINSLIGLILNWSLDSLYLTGMFFILLAGLSGGWISNFRK